MCQEENILILCPKPFIRYHNFPGDFFILSFFLYIEQIGMKNQVTRQKLYLDQVNKTSNQKLMNL